MTAYAELDAFARRRTKAAAELAQAQQDSEKIRERGPAAARLLLAAERKVARSRAALDQATLVLEAALDASAANADPAVPLLLLPVRLETRYDTGSAGRVRLRIRVYPDDIHTDSHEPALTQNEVAAGKLYWQTIWAPADRAERLAGWTRLVTTVGSERATWVASCLTPTNLGQSQPPKFPSPAVQGDRWMRAAQARLLPDRWVAHAWRAGTRIAEAKGTLIPRPLACGPDPMDGGQEFVDPGMLWMTDFTEAVRVGMGLVMDLPDAGRVDLLTVVGITSSDPMESAAAVQSLLEAQSHTAGLDLVPLGSATNNSDAARSAHGRPDPGGTTLFEDPQHPRRVPVSGDGGDADLLARALGIRIGTFDRCGHAMDRSVSSEADMATVLWPGTWGYYLTQMLRLDDFDTSGAGWRRWILDTVRSGGPLPVLRIGRQPYGLLPVTSLEKWRPEQRSGLVVAEVFHPDSDPWAVTTAVRILGGLDQDGGWTFQPERSFELPAPFGARSVAIGWADLDGDGLPEIIVAHVGDETIVPACQIARLDKDGMTVSGEFTVPTASPLSGLALAAGVLARPGSLPMDDDVVLVEQYPPAAGTPTALLRVARGISADGSVGEWLPPVDVSTEFNDRERILSAALVPGSGGTTHLVVISAAPDGSVGPGEPPLLWRVARRLQPDGHAKGGWSAPVAVGGGADSGIRLAGGSIAVADVDPGSPPKAVLTQFWSVPDGGSGGSYRVSSDWTEGEPGTFPGFWNLGNSAVGPGSRLIAGAATCIPWTPYRDPMPGLGNASRCVNLLELLISDWEGVTGRVARVHSGDPDSGRTLLDLLSADAVSTVFNARPFVGPKVRGNIRHLLGQPGQSDPPPAQANLEALLGRLGIQVSRPPLLGRGGYTANDIPLSAPLVEAPGQTGHEPARYLAEMSEATAADLHTRWTEPGTPLLARLVRHSLLQAYADAAFALIPVPASDPPPLPEPELVDAADLTALDPFTPADTLTSWRHLSQETYQGMPIADFLFKDARGGKPLPEVEPLAQFLAALRRTAKVPGDDLGRLAAGVLDLATHRLDAWVTAVSTDRLRKLRSARPEGLQTGGFGVVCGLEPATADASTGYIHAPSMLHGATAAVLRSGFLTHGGQDLAIDLSSTRVRGALSILQAVREGQKLGAVLGYRFERDLQERGLAKYLEPFRQISPQDVGTLTAPPAGTGIQTVAALPTVNGLALLNLAEHPGLPWGTTPAGQSQKLPGTGDPDRTALDAALERLKDAADAIADIGIAESVHQSIQRNPIRAAGTLDALSRGDVPPPEDPEVLRTPRTGTGVIHRLLATVPDPASAPAAAALKRWTATSKQRERHVRASGEPRLNAWAALRLGDPSRVHFTVKYPDPESGEPLHEPEEITLAQTGLCPLDVLCASSPGVGNLTQTNLGRRLLRYAARRTTVTGAQTVIDFERQPDWPLDVLSVPELLTLAESARNLVMGARAADRRDLTADRASPPGIDASDLSQRAAHAANALAEALETLRAYFTVETAEQRTIVLALFPGAADSLQELTCLLDLPLFCDISAASMALKRPTTTTVEELRDTLELMSAFGIPGTAPESPAATIEQARQELSRQARAVALAAAGRLRLAGEAEDDLARIEAIFGEGFRALPLFTPDPAASLVAPLGADDTSVDEWFDQVAPVREPAARLQEVLLGSAVTGGGEVGWKVLQFPRPRERWAALPPQTAPLEAGTVSVVLWGGNVEWDGAGPLAALAVDEWVELVPGERENTAVTFHFDAPGACPPQTALLALHPDPVQPWSLDLVADLVKEMVGLATVRAVDPDLVPQLGHLLPAIHLAHNLGGDPAGDTISTTGT
jgi:hypothetical protein